MTKLKLIAEQYLANNSKLTQDICGRLVANYKANLEEDEGLNADSNAMVDDKINDEGYGSGTIVNSEKFGARNDGATSANVSNFSSIDYISFPYAQEMMGLEGVETDYISQH